MDAIADTGISQRLARPPITLQIQVCVPGRIANITCRITSQATSPHQGLGLSTLGPQLREVCSPQGSGIQFLELSPCFVFPLIPCLLPAWFESENGLHGAAARTCDRREEGLDKINCTLCALSMSLGATACRLLLAFCPAHGIHPALSPAILD